jgi:hypothetical protein
MKKSLIIAILFLLIIGCKNNENDYTTPKTDYVEKPSPKRHYHHQKRRRSGESSQSEID